MDNDERALTYGSWILKRLAGDDHQSQRELEAKLEARTTKSVSFIGNTLVKDTVSGSTLSAPAYRRMAELIPSLNPNAPTLGLARIP